MRGGGLNRLKTADSVTTSDTSSYVKVGELFDSDTKTFNQDNYKILLKYLTGDANATIATATALAETNNNQYASSGYVGTDASVLRAKTLSAGTQGSTSYAAKSSSQDITVRLGGLDWTVTYLSKDINGNTIATLWLDDSYQEAWVDETYDSSRVWYSFDDGYLLSPWGDCYLFESLDEDDEYIGLEGNPYWYSRARAEVLNNGGYERGMYYDVNDELNVEYNQFIQSPTTVFSLFTMNSFGLIEYLVTPSEVEWQYSQEDISEGSEGFWSEYLWEIINAPDGAGTWQFDYLWLPSNTEIGASFNLWNASSNQTNSSKDYWLRTIYGIKEEDEFGDFETVDYSPYYYAAYYKEFKSHDDYHTDEVYRITSFSSLGVRPALHLNLSAINESFEEAVKVDELFDSESKTFNKDNYDILLKYLTGNANATLNTVSTVANANSNQYSSSGYTGTDASYFRNVTLAAGTSGSTSYKEKGVGDVKVTLGGLQWDCVYLSQDKNGDTVLTLWLDSNKQDAWAGLANNRSSNVGSLINGGVYSSWLDNGVNVLDNVFSKYFNVFISSQYGLTNYLVHGENISWQMKGSLLRSGYSFYENNAGTAAVDYLWLPSFSEVGVSSSSGVCDNDVEGLWNLSSTQKRNERCYTGFDTYDGDYFYNSYFLRTIQDYDTSWAVYCLSVDGNDVTELSMSDEDDDYDYSIHAVRPALHLNLSAIYEELYGGESEDDSGVSVTILPTVSAYSEDYALAPSVIVKYDGVILTQNVDYTITFSVNMSALTGSGIVQLIGSYEGARSFNFRIAKLEFDNGTYVVMSP